MRDERSFLTLAAEIRQELSGLSRLADEIPATWSKGSALPEAERRPYVESTALKLHNFYTACERILEKIADEVHGVLHTLAYICAEQRTQLILHPTSMVCALSMKSPCT